MNTALKKAADLKPGDKVVMEDGAVRTVKGIGPGFGTFLDPKTGKRVRGVIIDWQRGEFTHVARTQECTVKLS